MPASEQWQKDLKENLQKRIRIIRHIGVIISEVTENTRIYQ